MSDIFRHADPEKLAALKTFGSPTGVESLKVSNKDGYDTLLVKSAGGAEGSPLACLLGVTILDKDTSLFVTFYLHEQDTVTFINSGKLSEALAGVGQGLLVQHAVQRGNASGESFHSGAMISNLKHRFKVIIFNPVSEFEHVLFEHDPIDPTRFDQARFDIKSAVAEVCGKTHI